MEYFSGLGKIEAETRFTVRYRQKLARVVGEKPVLTLNDLKNEFSWNTDLGKFREQEGVEIRIVGGTLGSWAAPKDFTEYIQSPPVVAGWLSQDRLVKSVELICESSDGYIRCNLALSTDKSCGDPDGMSMEEGSAVLEKAFNDVKNGDYPPKPLNYADLCWVVENAAFSMGMLANLLYELEQADILNIHLEMTAEVLEEIEKERKSKMRALEETAHLINSSLVAGSCQF